MNKITLPEQFKIVQAIAPAAGGSALTGDYVSLKNAHRAWIVVNITQGNAATVAIGVNQAAVVAGTGAAAVTDAFKIWANQDTAAGDSLVQQTDAATFTTSVTVKNKQVVILVDPAKLDNPCIAVTAGASNAANIVQAEYFLETRYPGDNPPSAIVD